MILYADEVRSAPPKFESWRTFPLIGELDEADAEAIYPYLRINIYRGGTAILRQGQPCGSFHILLEGQLEILLEKDREISVAKLEPGHFVGEMSCLTGKEVSATVKAIGTVRTLSMPRQGILLLMDRSASFRNRMIQAMIERIGKSNDRVLEEHTRSFAVMRQWQSEQQSQYGELVGSSLFMCHLRERIAEWAVQAFPLCLVGEKGVGKLHAAYEIHRRSHRAEYPIISLDGAEFCMEDWEAKVHAAEGGTVVLKHADSLPADILNRCVQSLQGTRLIMTASDLPKVKVREFRIIPLRERASDIPELVHVFLAAAGASEPLEAISSEALNMVAAYPYLRGNVQELKRVVQDAFIVSGGRAIRNTHLRFGGMREPGSRPKIGLALGSGSSRGAAHVGVLKVLEQEGVPIDLIAGTSVGAFIGALYAGGQPISAFERVLPTVRWRQLVRFALPHQALVSNHPMAGFLEKYIGPAQFEDLAIPFAAVATDARSGEAYIFNQGRVSHAVCASTAIPGIIKPVNYEQRLLVDGAVVHPVPVALAKSMGADIVIAVDLSAPASANGELKNFVVSVLNTIDIMNRKILVEELQLADIVLNPRSEINQISFKASAHHIAQGEKAAREAIASIKEKLAMA